MIFAPEAMEVVNDIVLDGRLKVRAKGIYPFMR